MFVMDRKNKKVLNLSFFMVMIVVGLTILSACGTTPKSTSSGTITPVSFAQDVAPIFNQRCIQCHSGDQASAQLDLSSYSGVIAGSSRGAVVTAGDAGNSRLIEMVSSGLMPKSGALLTADQIATLENWVNSGAKDN